ncbi:molybdate ABC transporter substrate-binding protein [Bordetella avium]|uniref:Molybdenum ABC transporter, molybdate-binding periplasmic protein n=1 Tax=Bordetella avium (strain 197N) TaxID=360910 RepID=Q2KXK8_BORA1|nr:molybdate ABC transporter substrate-binding protein [Bordetella avium]AZY53183.1 molybdate ABC transporter substrate-binding protein [Bordetella avium]RIQ17563.1 molybdate ABC transporter substrate-binding protein [Bordetella avium]RIQ32220.1 molybdate ABC transporter substrate-binding protein [Bordetella avium]RIQ50856.1 molybdate ABC transporter substrate-binding protein [Bordetella avium]RIQ67799.1 molybdate ABC transporter substrate-binding protein [Bordetella avium]
MKICSKIVFSVLTAMFSAGAAHAADLTVSAAASLTNAFKELGQAYEAKHPGNKVVLNFAASDVLLHQIEQGAPADVFASADQAAMDRAVAQKAVLPDTRANFAANALVLIVPATGGPDVKSTEDLKSDRVKRVAYGNPASVPVGRYTQSALEQQGLWNTVSAKGVPAQNVRQSLDYVARGEVDAGFVFATDAIVMPDKVKVVTTVPTPQAITYPIARTTRDANKEAAQAFIDFARSEEGQQILARYGFKKP